MLKCNYKKVGLPYQELEVKVIQVTLQVFFFYHALRSNDCTYIVFLLSVWVSVQLFHFVVYFWHSARYSFLNYLIYLFLWRSILCRYKEYNLYTTLHITSFMWNLEYFVLVYMNTTCFLWLFYSKLWGICDCDYSTFPGDHITGFSLWLSTFKRSLSVWRKKTTNMDFLNRY